MISKARIDISKEKMAEFCRHHHILKLSLFGSVLREDYRPDSDVDVLVEFEPDHGPARRGSWLQPDRVFPVWRRRQQQIPWDARQL